MRHQFLLVAALLGLLIMMSFAAADDAVGSETEDETSLQYKERHHHHKHHRKVHPPLCSGGLTYCPLTRSCVSLTTNANCGACGNVCSTNDTCLAGVCANCPVIGGNYTAPVGFNCTAASDVTFTVFLGGGGNRGGCRCPREGGTTNDDNRLPVGSWYFDVSLGVNNLPPSSNCVLRDSSNTVIWTGGNGNRQTARDIVVSGRVDAPADRLVTAQCTVASGGYYVLDVSQAYYACDC